MKRVAWRSITATCGLLLAAALHPALPPALHPPPVALPALALLLVTSLVLGARDPGERLVAGGALVVALAFAYDGLRGHRGTLALEAGQGTQSFEEEGPGGRSLGLRPLGFGAFLERADAGGALLKVENGPSIAIGPGRAVSYGGFRFAASGPAEAGEPAALRLAVAGPQGSTVVDVRAGAPAEADGLEIAVEQYFPDFALDAKQQPYTRSSEPRNPAALLRVSEGSRSWRLFVIRAMPGIHRPAGLDRTISLTDVVASEGVTLRVSREPAAAVALAGMALVALGLAWGARAA